MILRKEVLMTQNPDERNAAGVESSDPQRLQPVAFEPEPPLTDPDEGDPDYPIEGV